MILPKRILSAALVSGALLSSCGGSGGSSTVTVSLSEFGFTPSTVKLRVGSSLTFINKDTKTHTVTSSSCSDLSGPQLAPGKSYSVGLGTVARSCDIFDSESLPAANYNGVVQIVTAG